MTQPPPTALDEALRWFLPGQHGTPGEVLPRIQFVCQNQPDLFSAMLLLLATHQGLPREILAAATKQCRSDLDDLTREDVVGLYTALLNGGRQGFDAVLRSRRKGERKTGGFGAWVKE